MSDLTESLIYYAKKCDVENWAEAMGEAADRIEALETAQAWRPIETAPRDKPVMAWHVKRIWIIAYPTTDGGWHDGIGNFLHSRITHWMPLPEPPAP